MSKVVRFHAFGGPEVLQIDEVEVGDPGPGEVRIRVGAIGLNRAEALFRSGAYIPTTFPSTIGFDAAGVIQAVGPGVEGWKVGDRVATLTGASMEQHGTNGETILFPADMLAPLLPGQSLVEGAAVWMQYFTAYAIVDVGHVGPGDHVAITAASSSVGLAAIQIANAHGAIPIAITRGRGKAEALLREGAAHVIVSNEEDIAARIRQLTGGVGARIVFDPVGGSTFSTLAGCTAPGGVLILYGALAGVPSEFPWMGLLGLNLTVRGYAADILSTDAAIRPKVVEYVLGHLRRGAFRPVIDRTFALESIVEAHRHLESNTQFGKIVVTTASKDE